jgi:hypothetical protein
MVIFPLRSGSRPEPTEACLFGPAPARTISDSKKDQRNGKVTHKIDPLVDGERDHIGESLQQAGQVRMMHYFTPTDAVQDARNATGGG